MAEYTACRVPCRRHHRTAVGGGREGDGGQRRFGCLSDVGVCGRVGRTSRGHGRPEQRGWASGPPSASCHAGPSAMAGGTAIWATLPVGPTMLWRAMRRRCCHRYVQPDPDMDLPLACNPCSFLPVMFRTTHNAPTMRSRRFSAVMFGVAVMVDVRPGKRPVRWPRRSTGLLSAPH